VEFRPKFCGSLFLFPVLGSSSPSVALWPVESPLRKKRTDMLRKHLGAIKKHVGSISVTVLVTIAVSVVLTRVVDRPWLNPPAERPARSPVSGSLTKKTIVYYGDNREPESRRVRQEVFEWGNHAFPLETSLHLVVRHRKDDDKANVHVVEISEFPQLAKERKVASFPCWIFLNDNKEIERRYGFINAKTLNTFWDDET
jgi:hypothetical protein